VSADFTHLDEFGRARMVDVGAKAETRRTATARGRVIMKIETLRLIDHTLTQEQWKRFSEEHRNRIGDNSPRFLPWVLDEASEENTAIILGRMPEQLQARGEPVGVRIQREAPHELVADCHDA